MSAEIVYLIDSNILIQAHRKYYPFDVVPSFWVELSNLANKGTVKSIDKVKIEIVDNGADGDLLKDWCISNLPEDFFIDSSVSLEYYIKITKWANSGGHPYTTRALEKFLATDYADAWLTAMAHFDKKYQLVTEEISAPDIKREIKIPEVCNAFGLEYINTIELLRRLGVRI